MTIIIESTSQMIEINGVPARVWEGKTQRGQKVVCAITRIACEESANQAEFQADLREQKPPSDMALKVFPLRMVI
jgi:hypothetical protein